MTVNVVIYPPKLMTKCPSLARIFLSDCDTLEPVQLAEHMLSRGYRVYAATWDFSLLHGTVDIMDKYYQEPDALKTIISEELEDYYKINLKEQEE